MNTVISPKERTHFMSITKRSFAIIALTTIVAAAGCNKPEGEGKLLATVNGSGDRKSVV